MSPWIPALHRPLLALALVGLACAVGERYDSSESASSITGANASASVADSDTEEPDPSAAQTGPWTSASASNGSSVTNGTVTNGSTSGDATTWDTWDVTGDSSSSDDSTSGSSTDDPTGLTSTTDADCGGPCNQPPGPCHDPAGACIAGNCEYSPKDAGLACDDGDECTADDVCDGIGGCVGGDAVDCSPPAHAKGGTCQNGKCTSFTCVSPYENCDGNWDNGCEVPTKVANQCDKNGINPNGGCWTAYCGSSNHADAHNFGTYYCSECSNCHVPSPNMAQWCDHSNGVWYPPEAGGCGGYLDLACPAL